MKLNSAQHARSAASRLDDVIDRSALEQAREGFRRPGYIEELLIGLGVQKSTLEVQLLTTTQFPPIRSSPRSPPSLIAFLFLWTLIVWTQITCPLLAVPFLEPSDSEMARNPNALSTMKALLFVPSLYTSSNLKICFDLQISLRSRTLI